MDLALRQGGHHAWVWRVKEESEDIVRETRNKKR
jgi:hypothetical protein